MRRHRGLVLAFALTAAFVSFRRHASPDHYDRHLLPGFDAFVYLAMAEHPAYFTVGPWGYRVLNPWLAHVLAPGNEVAAFYWISGSALTLAGGLLFLFLRRLGHGEIACLATVAAFCLSAPVSVAVGNAFLTEPLGVALELAFLLALQAGAALPVLCLAMVTGELTKEIFVLFLPTLFFAARERSRPGRALCSASLCASAVLLVHLALRRFWAPYPPLAEASSLGASGLWLGLQRVVVAWPEWWTIVGAAGLPLALIGACLEEARGFMRRYGYQAALTVALPLAVAADVSPGGPRRSAPFLPEDVERLFIYALPLVLPLALVALGRLWSKPRPKVDPAPPSTPNRRTTLLAALVLGAVLLCPLVFLQRYRRVDLRTSRDGPRVLALTRESLRFASLLEQGRPVFYDLLERRYRRGKDDRGYMERMRWFLLSGFGPTPEYGEGPASLLGGQGSFLLSCLTPRDLDMVVTVDNPEPLTLAVSSNDQPIGQVALGASARNRFVVRVPAHTLFSGDNVVTLAIHEREERPLRLLGVTLRPTGDGAAKPGASGADRRRGDR